MKLRYWYKIDHKKEPIPGSNIRRKSRPGASHQWKEILDPCCSPLDLDCTCGPRFFVQLDGGGKPVDGTLIKRVDQPRNNVPEGTDGKKLYEIDWKSACCAALEWSFNPIEPGQLVININGNIVVNANTLSSGSIIPNTGDEILVAVSGATITTLVVTGGGTFNQTNTDGSGVSYNFVWTNKKTTVFGQSDE